MRVFKKQTDISFACERERVERKREKDRKRRREREGERAKRIKEGYA